MRRHFLTFVAIVTLGLVVAISLGKGVEALSGGQDNQVSTASFKKDDKDATRESDNGGNSDNASDNGNGNGNSENAGDNGNGGNSDNASDNGNGNGNSENAGDNGNSSSNSDNASDNGNGNGNSENAGDNGSGNGNGNVDDEGSSDDEPSDGNAGEDDADDGSDDTDDSNKHEKAAKVRVCHLTGRDDFPYNLIEVSENALPAHEKHGDFAAPDDAVASNGCDSAAGTPVATVESTPELEGSPEASPVVSDKVLVCHVTSSDENPVILIEISDNALSAHEDHGDFMAPDDADSSSDCENAMATPVASPEASPEV